MAGGAGCCLASEMEGARRRPTTAIWRCWRRKWHRGRSDRNLRAGLPAMRTLDLRDAWWSVWLTFTPPPPHHHHQRRATRPPDVDQDAWSTWNHFWHSIEETPGGQLGLNRQPEMRDTPPGVDQDARSAQNSFRRPIEETPGGEFGSSDTFPPHTGSKQIKSFRETRINVPGICSSR